MTDRPELHVALAADQRYFPGLLVTAASVVFCCDVRTQLTLHILDGGITEASWSRLETLVRRLHPRASVVRLPVRDSGIRDIRDNGNKSPMAYARLLLPRLLKVERVVYVDSDCLALRDLGELMSCDLGGCPCGAVQDPINPSLGDDYPWPRPPGFDPALPYFNSGLLVIDLARWRQEAITERTLELLTRQGDRCRYWDQTALNYILPQHWQPLSAAWNYPSNKFNCQRAGDAAVIHYLCNEKPWFGDPGGHAHGMWRQFATEVAGVDRSEWPWTILRDRLRLRVQDSAAGVIGAVFRAKTLARSRWRGVPPDPSDQWAIRYWTDRHAARHDRREDRARLRCYLAERRESWRATVAARSGKMI